MGLVDKYMFSFFQDMDALGIRRPNVQPRASMHILDMIEITRRLMEKGHAYAWMETFALTYPPSQNTASYQA